MYIISINLYIYIYLSVLSIYISIYLSIYLSVYLVALYPLSDGLGVLLNFVLFQGVQVTSKHLKHKVRYCKPSTYVWPR